MSSLKDLKPSITELSEDERVQLIIASRQRRIGFRNKPDKRENKKLINKLSQEEKRVILKQLEGMDSKNATNG